MGCRVARANEEAVVMVQVKKENEVKGTEDGIKHNEEVSEYSLRECSLIPAVVDANKRRVSEDPSMYAMIEDLQ